MALTVIPRIRAALAGLILSVNLNAAEPVALQVVSKPHAPTPHTFGDSGSPLLSADGRWVAFGSSGNGLATNDNNGLLIDAFLRDLQTGTTLLISRNPGGAAANGDSVVTDISADGNLVLFESDADDLVSGDDNETNKLFLYDRQKGSVERIVESEDGESSAVQMTRNGRFILFESTATELADVDTNEASDLYLLDRESGKANLVTLNAAGTAPASSGVESPFLIFRDGAVSEDGRYVAFVSYGTNHVVPALPLSAGQLYIRDMLAGTNAWVSHTSSNTLADTVSGPLFSTNGTILAFLATGLSASPNVQWLHYYDLNSQTLHEVPYPPGISPGSSSIEEYSLSANGRFLVYTLDSDVYRYDRGTDTTTAVSAAPGGVPVTDGSSNPLISDDGSVVLFTSAASKGAVSDYYQLYRYDATGGTVALLSTNLAHSSGGNADVLFPAIDSAGSKAAFMSYASDLVPGDDKTANDVFAVATTGTNAIELVSTPFPGSVSVTAAGTSSLQPNALSDDGRFAVFSSIASDVVPGDDNNNYDIFLQDLGTGVTRLVSTADGVSPFATSSALIDMSRDGRYVAFSANETPTNRVIYIYDAQLQTNVVASISPDGSIVSSSEARLSRNGEFLAFALPRGASQGVYVRDLLNQTTTLVTNSTFSVQQFTLSPSGKYLLLYPNNSSALLIDWKAHSARALPASGFYTASIFSEDESAMLLYTPRPPLAPIAPVRAPTLNIFTLGDNQTNMIATNVQSAALSADGNVVVAWEQRAELSTELVAYDLKKGTARSLLGVLDTSFRISGDLALSRDGRHVGFTAKGALVSGTDNGWNNAYLFDRVLTNLTLLNRSLDGSYSEFGGSDVSLSKDGRTVLFQSGSPDLILKDKNVASDVFAGRIPAVDSDGDQLEDGWEIVHLNGLQSTASADDDGDGMTNLAEFLSGTDPASSGSVFAIESVASGQGESIVRTSGVAGKTYQLQSRPGVSSGSWQDVGSPITAVSSTVELRAPVNAEATSFYRVRLVE